MRGFALKRVLVSGATLAIAILAGYQFLTRPSGVRVVRAANGIVAQEVKGPGNVRARISVSVGSKITGLITQVFVDQGDAVQRGQLLAVLESDDLAARVQAARAAQSAAEEEIRAAEAALAKAEADLALARSNYERDTQLFQAEVTSRAAFDASTASLRSAESGVHSARASLTARKAQRLSAEHELRYAEAQLQYTRIVSPMDGLITSRRLEAGSTVVPGGAIFQMVDPKTLWVATLIDQTLAGSIRQGQPARIQLRSGEALEGTVARVTREADRVTRELEVDIAFRAMPARLTIDEEADVAILIGEVHGLVVPSSALGNEAGVSGVYVVNENQATFRPVRLGAVNSHVVQVVNGLKLGELVAVQPVSAKFRGKVEPQIASEN